MPDEPTIDLQSIPAFDHHCHNWRRIDTPFERDQYRLYFTEAVDPRVATDIQTTVYYRWVIRELARVFDCEASEERVLAVRAELGHAEVARRLMAEANIGGAIVDFGFAGRGRDLYSVAEMGPLLGGAATWGALRLETVLEGLINEYDTAAAVEDAYRAQLDAAALRAAGIVSLKSIIAYRTGLGIVPTARADGHSAFDSLKATARERGRVRIADRDFLNYFIGAALAWASDEGFPIQFHTGFGDPSVDLATGNPIALRPVLESERYRAAPIVLLHAGWPYVREASYLANVYPNVWVDAGLAIPFAASEYETIWQQLLSLAPTNKVLWSSDGFALPEHTWFAARQGRKALARTLGDLAQLGAIGSVEIPGIAADILNRNAQRLYGGEEGAL